MAAPHDLDPTQTWVTSDSHFGHQNIVGFCHRPEDHETVMMEEWAQAVPEWGTVLHLGDLAYRNNAWFKNIIAKHLTGARKLLVKGNHDHQRYRFYKDCGFKLVRPFEIRYRNHIVSFSHYPWSFEEEGNKIPSNHVRLHGHIHNNGYTRDAYVPFLAQHINLSAEQTKYRPVRLDLLLNGYLFGEVPSYDDPVGYINEQQGENAHARTAS